MVVQMIPGTFKQTPYGAPLFGVYKGSAFCVGNRIETVKALKKEPEASLFPLSVRRDKGRLLHFPLSQARKMWGFYEVA